MSRNYEQDQTKMVQTFCCFSPFRIMCTLLIFGRAIVTFDAGGVIYLDTTCLCYEAGVVERPVRYCLRRLDKYVKSAYNSTSSGSRYNVDPPLSRLTNKYTNLLANFSWSLTDNMSSIYEFYSILYIAKGIKKNNMLNFTRFHYVWQQIKFKIKNTLILPNCSFILYEKKNSWM